MDYEGLEDLSGAIVYTEDGERGLIWYKGGSQIHYGHVSDDGELIETGITSTMNEMDEWPLARITDKLAEKWDEYMDDDPDED